MTRSFGIERGHMCDGILVVQERNSANTPSVTYTRGNDLSGTLQGAGGWTSEVLTVRCPVMDDRFTKLSGGMLARSQGYSSGSWTTHHFYHADGNGNITYLVNSSQTLGASYKYNPFGGTISSSGTYAGANRYRFSSKEVNVSNGTYYYGYRWYHSNLQRWLNRDPLGEEGGINLYRFSGNDPLNRIDSFGLQSPRISIPALIESGFTAEEIAQMAGISVAAVTEAIAAHNASKCDPPKKNPCKGLREQLQKRMDKLAQYKKDPDSMDNQNILKNNPDKRDVSHPQASTPNRQL